MWPWRHLKTDHPRSRGVYQRINRPDPGPGGSSPLARGLPTQTIAGDRNRRIIPARAGFTPPVSGHPWPGRDHPRSRGVYAATRIASVGARGSSPLARGLLAYSSPALIRHGIIPARAGFTSPRHFAHFRPSDHPRSRGVYMLGRSSKMWLDGSSPLARG